jgi:hypothetical protein
MAQKLGKTLFNRFALHLILDLLCTTYSKRTATHESKDHIEQAKDTLISLRSFPPLKGKTINSIFEHLDPLMEFKTIIYQRDLSQK